MICSLKKNQVYQVLRKKILAGELPSGSKLPSETKLAVQLGVSRVTLRSSLALLTQEGLIDRVDRKGTFVSETALTQRYIIFTPENNSISNPHIYIVTSLRQKLSEAGFKSDICTINCLRALTKHDLQKFFADNHVVGIFLAISNFVGNEPEIELLKDCEIPIVIPHGSGDDGKFWNCPVMQVNFRAAFAAGVKNLIRQGHRRIATLNLEYENLTFSHDFTPQEYRLFLEENHADTAPELIQRAIYEPTAIYKVVKKWLQLPQPPTAIICFSDFMAIHVYQALLQLKVKIPEDISVMGCCGYASGKFLTPPLSTIDFHYEDIGRQAVDLMLNSAEWFHTPQQKQVIFTPYSLVDRQSVASFITPINQGR